MPNDSSGRPVIIDQTVDQPSAVPIETPPSAPPHAGPSTVRRADTSLRSGQLQADVRTGEFSDPSAQTGGFAPSDVQADLSSRTGGYTPSDIAKPKTTGEPTVRGYEILGELGRGGMGVVYKAKQIGLDRLVALKMILAGAHARPKDLERFRAEAQAVARFQHPNIVQIYEVGESDGLPYFSLEFVDGGTLAGKIAREPQAPRFAAETMEAIARAMQYAHERDVVHRDLKPANVLLAEDGTPKVTDFGLAKRLEQDSGQTQAGTVLGTPSYMAPEQAMGDTDQVGPPADVYALGAMLYDLLTGRPPFAGSSVLDTLEMVRTREPVPPGQLAAKLPRDLETICLKCLQKEATKRYVTAGELADDLRRYLDGKPILARPVGALERTWRWSKRNPWVAGFASATAVLILAVAVITSVMSYRLNNKKNEAEDNFRAAKIAEEKEAEQKRIAEMSRDKAQKAQEVTGAQRNLALDVVRGISRDVDAQLGNKQSLAPLRIAIQQKMLSDVDKIRDHAEKNPLADRGEAVAMSRLGDIYKQANRVQDAARHYRMARTVFEQFVKDFPDDPVGRRNLAALNNNVAETELRLGNAAEARELYAEGLKLRQRWFEMIGSDGKDTAKQTIAESYALLGHVNLELGEPAVALENYRAADKEYSALPKGLTGTLNVQRDRIGIRDQMAVCLYKLGQADKAEAEHQAAFKDRENLAKSAPQAGYLKRDLAFSRQALGDFYLFNRKDAAKALTEYGPAYREFVGHAKADPDDLNAKREVSALAYRMGFVAGRLADMTPVGGPALRLAAGSFYQECLTVRMDLAKADPKDTRGQIDVMIVQARLGRSAEVEKMAASLMAQAGTDRRVLFQTACGLAVAGGGTGPAADRCRTQAFKVLGALVDQGWKDRVGLETDPDLEPVRDDQRFANLLARMAK